MRLLVLTLLLVVIVTNGFRIENSLASKNGKNQKSVESKEDDDYEGLLISDNETTIKKKSTKGKNSKKYRGNSYDRVKKVSSKVKDKVLKPASELVKKAVFKPMHRKIRLVQPAQPRRSS